MMYDPQIQADVDNFFRLIRLRLAWWLYPEAFTALVLLTYKKPRRKRAA